MEVEFMTIPVLKLETGEYRPYLQVEKFTYENYGLILVKEFNWLYGLINEKGEEVLSTKYGRIGYFQPNGLSIVKDKDCLLCGLINEKGIELVSPKYGEIEYFQPNGLAIVHDKDTRLYGIINEKGAEILQPSYSLITID